MTRWHGFKRLRAIIQNRPLQQELNTLGTDRGGNPDNKPNQFIRSHDNGLNRTVSEATVVSSSGDGSHTIQDNEQ